MSPFVSLAHVDWTGCWLYGTGSACCLCRTVPEWLLWFSGDPHITAGTSRGQNDIQAAWIRTSLVVGMKLHSWESTDCRTGKDLGQGLRFAAELRKC